jgi:H+/gluconate symporter-like permease
VELAGVLIAVLLLIFLIYKRLSLIPATLICVAVLALTNGFSYMDLFINHYGVSLAGFVGKYFLVFVTNALFGKVMEETLLASVFSKMIGKLFGDKNAVFGAMLATAILSYLLLYLPYIPFFLQHFARQIFRENIFQPAL